MTSSGPRLSEAVLPEHHFAERHAIEVAATPEGTMAAVARLSLTDDPLARALLRLRALPAALVGGRFAARREAEFSLRAFTALGQVPGREIAWGLIGRLWRADGGLEAVPDAAAFRAYARPGRVKLVWSFEAEPRGGGTSLATRTRIWCIGAEARRRFAAYWVVVRPWSGLVRRRLLSAVKAQAEVADPAGGARHARHARHG